MTPDHGETPETIKNMNIQDMLEALQKNLQGMTWMQRKIMSHLIRQAIKKADIKGDDLTEVTRLLETLNL